MAFIDPVMQDNRQTLLPGSPGTKNLADKCGDRLLCVRC